MSSENTNVKPAPAMPDLGGGLLHDPRPCTRCSYNLQGLPISGACPECAAPVADSLKGILLQHAAPEYIRTVRSGLSLILSGTLLSIVVAIPAALLQEFVLAPAGATALVAQAKLLAGLLSLTIYILIFVGYVKATEPDPGFVGTEKPDAARKLVRRTAMWQMAIQVLTVLCSFAILQGSTTVTSLPLGFLTEGLSVLGLVLWVMQFFAMMRYTRWLGSRVPDAFIIRRSKTYLWLLPILCTLGLLLIFLGPLIALALYWNLLDRMRKHLTSIEATGRPASLPMIAT